MHVPKHTLIVFCPEILCMQIVGRQLWNVNIKVGDKHFLAHREILAEQSDFLAELIRVSHHDVPMTSQWECIEIKPLPANVNEETFEIIVDYMYERELDIDITNDTLVHNLLEASSNLRVTNDMQEYLMMRRDQS